MAKDSIVVMGSRKSKKNRQYSDKRKRTKGQITTYKVLCRNLKNRAYILLCLLMLHVCLSYIINLENLENLEQHEPHLKSGWTQVFVFICWSQMIYRIKAIFLLLMSVKSSTELMLYVVLTMSTLNKAYLLLFIYYYLLHLIWI
jgi:magnesium-transporting ATPase (P-type)